MFSIFAKFLGTSFLQNISGRLLLGLTSFYLFLFIINSKLYHSARDNTLNSNMMKGNLDDDDFSIIQKWFYEDHMVVHLEKCNYKLTGSHILKSQIYLNGTEIEKNTFKGHLNLSVERCVMNH